MPKISVVMSVYNAEEFLSGSIESILTQTCRDFEFIIVDDASKDRSLQIIKNFAQKDPRIKLIRNGENIGLTKSLIKAITQAKGQYIARQDADDLSVPQRLEKQAEFLDMNPSYGAVGTSAHIIDRDGGVIKKAFVPKSWFLIRRLLGFGNCFVHGSMMFRKCDYVTLGGYRDFFLLSQDFDLWLRMSKITKIKNLKDTLYLWRRTNSNLTSNRIEEQFKAGALALYASRFQKSPKFKDGLTVENYIKELSPSETEKYTTCLRDLSLRHGLIELAEKYCPKRPSDYFLIQAAKFILGIIRIFRPL